VCSATCGWEAWGACTGEGACTPGATAARACGRCGTQGRTCGDECAWGDWGACAGERECAAGATESRSCGRCGTQGRSCSDTCGWGDWGACGGEGACAAGAVESRACGRCGLQARLCGAACAWGDWGACAGEGACTPAATESRACGRCGTQSRTCSSGCAWDDWGACGGEGACAPGAVETRACGRCGTQSRTCGLGCGWGDWGACGGEGGCTPGDPVTCTTTCGSTGTGACTGTCTPPIGAACTPPAETYNGRDDDCDGGIDEDWGLTVTALGCKTVTVRNSGTTPVTGLSITAGGAAVAFNPPAYPLAPGATATIRLAYVLDRGQEVVVTGTPTATCLRATRTMDADCSVRLGFAEWGDKGGDLLAVIRSINNDAAGGEFTRRTGLGVSTQTVAGAHCDLAYHQHFTVVESEDLSNLDLLYYHTHTDFNLPEATQRRLLDWVNQGGLLIFDDCGGATATDLRAAFGVYVRWGGNTSGAGTASTFVLDSDLYRLPFAYTAAEFSRVGGWDWGGQTELTGSVREIVHRGASPFVSGKAVGLGWLAFVGGDWGCVMNCSCTAGETQAHRLLMNFAYIASGRGRLIR
jgi:hypothetical protein